MNIVLNEVPTAPEKTDGQLSNYPKTGCNPRKIQDLRAFSDSYLCHFPAISWEPEGKQATNRPPRTPDCSHL